MSDKLGLSKRVLNQYKKNLGSRQEILRIARKTANVVRKYFSGSSKKMIDNTKSCSDLHKEVVLRVAHLVAH